MSAGEGNKIKGNDQHRGRIAGGALMMLLFAATIFISAALLFLIEPMFAKFVLPLFGGTPAVWTGSMLFFQATLLVSYLYVHATTSWLGSRRQAVLHLLVVLLPLLVLPIAVPAEEWAPPPEESNPILPLLGLLLVSVGLPFFAVSATNPLVQRWLADTDHPGALDPYFLYGASNLGSVIGLLGYPLVVERELRLAEQGWLWTVGYGLLIVLVLASAMMLWRSSSPASAGAPDAGEGPGAEEPGPPAPAGTAPAGGGGTLGDSLATGLSSAPTVLRRMRWVGLTFVPSSMMLGVTAFITVNITPVPLLWVLPLSLYLLSFVIVFSPSLRLPAVLHRAMVLALPLVIALLVVTMLTDLRDPFWLLILLHLFGFFVVAMVCHGEVARDRPPARYLTEFYLWVAVGGVLGGVFNALVAPIVFDSLVEYPLMIVAACLFVPGALLARLVHTHREERAAADGGVPRDGGAQPTAESPTSWLQLALDLALPLALGLTLWGLGYLIDAGAFDRLFGQESRALVRQAFIGLAVGGCLWFAYASTRPLRFGMGIAAIFVVGAIFTGAYLYEDRSFFGFYSVTGDEYGTGYHAIVVGDTNHGAQFLDLQPPVPIAYYDRTSPIGQVYDGLPEEVTSQSAVLGLGAGSMACYNQPGGRLTFYEIDPLVEQIARDPRLFTYLRDCPGDSEVILGDGRLKIAQAEDGEYGVILAAAFNSDAVPVHLLTREAIDLYLQKLQEDGVLVFNVSNRYVELEPVLGDIAREAGLVCLNQSDSATEGRPFKLSTQYVVMARQEEDLVGLTDPRWQPCASKAGSAWTDDFSNLLSTFKWGS